MAIDLKAEYLLSLTENLGINFIYFGDELKYSVTKAGWSTISLTLHFKSLIKLKPKYIYQQLAHELGHYIIASKTQKTKENYGLSFGKSGRSKKQMYDDFKARLVEHSILLKIHVPNESKKYIFRIANEYFGDDRLVKWWSKNKKDTFNQINNVQYRGR